MTGSLGRLGLVSRQLRLGLQLRTLARTAPSRPCLRNSSVVPPTNLRRGCGLDCLKVVGIRGRGRQSPCVPCHKVLPDLGSERCRWNSVLSMVNPNECVWHERKTDGSVMVVWIEIGATLTQAPATAPWFLVEPESVVCCLRLRPHGISISRSGWT